MESEKERTLHLFLPWKCKLLDNLESTIPNETDEINKLKLRALNFTK